MKKTLILFLGLGFLSLLSPLSVHAAGEWQIDSFASDLTIQKDGRVAVTETITADFGHRDKHGIYRDLPFVYENQQGGKIYTKIDIKHITRDQQNEPYSVSQNTANLEIKIGRSSHLLSGKHTYQITYIVTGILRSFSDFDELYWNTTGNSWDAPIAHAQATVHLPGELKKAVCYQGPPGSQNQCITTPGDQAAVFTTVSALPPGSGMTIAADFPHGLVPILTVAPPKNIWQQLLSFPYLEIALFLLMGGAGTIVGLWIRRGRDEWWAVPVSLEPEEKATTKPLLAHETIVVQFEPPEKLRPAELGVVMDERADTLDVTATIIDLAVRGYLTITEIPKQWVFGNTDYRLSTTRKDNSSLEAYEQRLLNKLFAGGESVTVSKLKQTFYDELRRVKAELYTDAVHKKFFLANPETIRIGYRTGGILLGVFFAIGIYFSLSQDIPLLLAVSLPGLLSAILLFLIARAMPHRTAYGRELYRQTRGFQLFLSSAEKYRQQFYEKQNLFTDLLPYAIVFGLTEKFATAMAQMGIKPPSPAWYSGSRPFNPANFGSSMQSFSSSLSSAIAAAPSGSGTGGGFSGGGFGGGGGGSW